MSATSSVCAALPAEPVTSAASAVMDNPPGSASPSRLSLLILPPPPSPLTQAVVASAYLEPLEHALSCTKSPDAAAILLVVVPITDAPLPWGVVQPILIGLYSTISSICVQNAIPSEADGGPGSVDSRVLFTPYKDDNLSHGASVVGMDLLVSTRNRFDTVLYVDHPFARLLLQRYTQLTQQLSLEHAGKVILIGTGTDTASVLESSPSYVAPYKSYSTVCLGGTFDHLHPGHKLLLSAAAALLAFPSSRISGPSRVVIGLTGDDMLKNKQFADLVQSWSTRAEAVIQFLSTVLEGNTCRPTVTSSSSPCFSSDGGAVMSSSFRDGALTVECVEIKDAFGPTVKHQDIGALVVSQETKSGGAAINERRQAVGWHDLDLYVVDLVEEDSQAGPEASDAEKISYKISSTSIRRRRAGVVP